MITDEVTPNVKDLRWGVMSSPSVSVCLESAFIPIMYLSDRGVIVIKKKQIWITGTNPKNKGFK